LCAHEYTDVLL